MLRSSVMRTPSNDTGTRVAEIGARNRRGWGVLRGLDETSETLYKSAPFGGWRRRVGRRGREILERGGFAAMVKQWRGTVATMLAAAAVVLAGTYPVRAADGLIDQVKGGVLIHDIG